MGSVVPAGRTPSTQPRPVSRLHQPPPPDSLRGLGAALPPPRPPSPVPETQPRPLPSTAQVRAGAPLPPVAEDHRAGASLSRPRQEDREALFLRPLTVLYKHHHSLVPEHSHHPKQNPPYPPAATPLPGPGTRVCFPSRWTCPSWALPMHGVLRVTFSVWLLALRALAFCLQNEAPPQIRAIDSPCLCPVCEMDTAGRLASRLLSRTEMVRDEVLGAAVVLVITTQLLLLSLFGVCITSKLHPMAGDHPQSPDPRRVCVVLTEPGIQGQYPGSFCLSAWPSSLWGRFGVPRCLFQPSRSWECEQREGGGPGAKGCRLGHPLRGLPRRP